MSPEPTRCGFFKRATGQKAHPLPRPPGETPAFAAICRHDQLFPGAVRVGMPLRQVNTICPIFFLLAGMVDFFPGHARPRSFPPAFAKREPSLGDRGPPRARTVAGLSNPTWRGAAIPHMFATQRRPSNSAFALLELADRGAVCPTATKGPAKRFSLTRPHMTKQQKESCCHHPEVYSQPTKSNRKNQPIYSWRPTTIATIIAIRCSP